MSDPILIEPEDLELYASGKICETEAAMRAKIKGCVPSKTGWLDKSPDPKENNPAFVSGFEYGWFTAIEVVTANLIAAGLMEGA